MALPATSCRPTTQRPWPTALALLIRDPALRQTMGSAGRRPDPGAVRIRGRRRPDRRPLRAHHPTPRSRLMRVAFYAPMKPPGHPVPSGDRRMARAFMALLDDLGHEVELASRLRTFDRDGRQPAAAAAGETGPANWRRAISRVRSDTGRICGSPTTSTTRRRTGWARWSAGRCASPMWWRRRRSSAKQAARPVVRRAMPPAARQSGRRTWFSR